ncbi:hypothetical protein RchiOBHm_Chr1g0358951 [Rosa chinensis]|uniref:Uncharacterized protein n=1 Tax=Rosa chinensis TaxID=74649 RepID=A0A2P6SIA5_ROSCH|nr:hypothetical protein RchiOBHm_Chr1g0358951 [Rosa chinensis]
MAEPDRVPDNEVGQVRQETEEREDEGHTTSELPDTQATAELNLLIVFLSLSSSRNSEESLEFAKKEQERQKSEAKAKIKRLQKRIDEAKPVRRLTTQKFKTTVIDSRHGRKM